MTSAQSWAVLFGLMLGVGLWSLVSMVPRLSKPRLSTRVAPYVMDVSDAARTLVDRQPANPLPVFGFVLAPLVERGGSLLTLVLGGSTTTAKRLRQAGSVLSVEEFRAGQLAWGAVGCVVALVGALVAGKYRDIPLLLVVGVAALGAVLGVLGREYLLQRAASARVERMASELPTVLEFLTLSLSAGEGILDAIRRISRISRGELSRELSTVTADVALGVPFAESLSSLATTIELPAFTRCVEQVIGALERGTPIVEVLRAQAQDVREESKRELLEIAGRKEVAMLVPLVFLILPTTVAFAIFPGILVLQMGL